MWVMGNQNLSYVGHDTNMVIKSYLGNLRTTLNNVYPRFDYEGIVRESYTPKKHVRMEIYIEKNIHLQKMLNIIRGN
jgi:hypothetical protein